jgi:hypothetical protein
MKRYYCRCGSEIFFDNTFCNVCGNSLGFIPEHQQMVRLERQGSYRPCQHRADLDCNWMIVNDDPNPQCRACRLTRTIPDLGVNNNQRRWAKLEATKRRTFYMLFGLQLPIPDRHEGEQNQLLFDFLEDQSSNPLSELDMVYTGHADGIITVNAAEADDSYRTAAQQQMNEAYRTLLGHFRHEMGHFYWMTLRDQADELIAFRQLFGDERLDYRATLQNFYNHGARSDWQNHFISPYASAHPLEDWAECWAHYLHISETLETAAAFGVIAAEPVNDSFTDWLSTWMRFSVVLNALNRSMGVSDPYPFVINASVERKLHFIERWVKTARRPG